MADQFDGNFEEILPDGKLPGDLMVSIFLKLPVKSLLKFRAVCKPCRLLISSPRFIKMHLHEKSICAQGSTFLSIWKDRGWEFALLTDNHKNNPATDDDVLVSGIPRPIQSKKNESILMLDSCNGLVCLRRSKYDKFLGIILWNPATRKYRWFKMTSKPRCPLFAYAGLGYVKATNDYKVVGVIRDFTDHSVFRTEMFVYTLRSNSWKKLDYDCRGFCVSLATPTTVNGRMHWTTSDICGSKNLIASFDVANEVMSPFMVPDDYGSVSEIERHIVAIRDCLAVLVFHNDIEVWIMREYGVQGSWAKQFTIDALPYELVQPPLSWKEGELLFRYNKDDDLNLMSYDPIRKTKKCYSGFRSTILFDVFHYVESLMSFERPQRSRRSIC